MPRVELVPVRGGNKKGRKKCGNLLAVLLGMEGGPNGEGMPRDVFRVVLDFLMPSWDPLQRERRNGVEQPMQD